jgi:hypothetical protein
MTPVATAGVYTNKLTDFDNEYVWHCHILGHEEQDFMRPFVFHPTPLVPDAPAAVTVAGTTVSWTDTTPYGGQDAQGIPTAGVNAAYPEPTSSMKNEIGFRVYVGATLDAAGYVMLDPSGKPTTGTVTPVIANVTSVAAPAGATSANTVVVAYNAAGSSLAGTSTTTTGAGALNGTAVVPVATSTAAPALNGPAGPTGLTQTLNAGGTFTLSWTGIAGATGYVVTITETTGAGVVQTPYSVTLTGTVATATTIPLATTYTTAALTSGSTFTFTVAATTLSGTTAGTTVAGGLTNSQTADPVAFTGTAGAVGSKSISLTWANNPLNKNNVANLNLTWTHGPAGGKTFPATSTGVTLIGLAAGSYSFTLQALSNVTSFNSGIVALPAAITAP